MPIYLHQITIGINSSPINNLHDKGSQKVKTAHMLKKKYHEACNCKVSWDKAIPENQKICWQRWEQSLLAEITTRRPLAPYQQPVVSAALHVLGNVNLWGRSGVFNCMPRRWNHSNPGCSESKISQERTNSPHVGVLSVPTWLPI